MQLSANSVSKWALLAVCTKDEPLLRVSRSAMGTEFQIVLSGRDERYLEQAANQALDEIERIDHQMSLYNPESELCWVNAHAGEKHVVVEPGLFGVLKRAAEISRATGGAFDVTVAPLVECWGFYRGTGKRPSQEEIKSALQRVGMAHVELNERDRSVHFDRPGIKIDLGGIAKGYAVDRAAVLLREAGIESALIHGGQSTVYGLGKPSQSDTWPIGVRHPYDPERRMTIVRLKDRALSTSGTYEKFFQVNGVIYSHILDPRTGMPVQGMLSASALTESALDSDALSTAFFLMGIEETREYCRDHPGIGAILVPQPAEGAEPKAVTIGIVG